MSRHTLRAGLLSVLLGWLLAGSPVSAQVLTEVGRTTWNNTSSGATCATTSATHTAGNLLVFVVQSQGFAATSVSSTRDGASWTATPKSPIQLSGGTNFESIFYVLSSAGGVTDVVTATLAGTDSYHSCAVYEFHTTSGSWSFLNDQTGTATTGTAIATGTLTLGGVNAFIVAQMESEAGGTGAPTAGTGFTRTVQDNGGNFVADEFLTSPSSTNQAAAATGAASAGWVIIGAAFGVGGGGATPILRSTLLGVGP